MTSTDIFQIFLFIGALIILAPAFGAYIAKALRGQETFLSPILGWIEKLIYKLCGVNSRAEMNWKEYAKSLLFFNFLGFFVLFLFQIL